LKKEYDGNNIFKNIPSKKQKSSKIIQKRMFKEYAAENTFCKERVLWKT
jgi:hypothetical protein